MAAEILVLAAGLCPDKLHLFELRYGPPGVIF